MIHPNDNKFMVTVPYPYMNGRLHLGHAFTIGRAEFTARYQRLKGKDVLFPFGFHVTGTPIVAAAEKLKRELEGCDVGTTLNSATNNNKKNNQSVSQKVILESMGVEAEEIAKFTDPIFWTTYFPPKATTDLKAFGAAIDWDRSFITTELNPYYDSFVRWQFSRLNEKGLLTFGKYHTIYSPKDGQPCADHDRSIGEGVGVAKYTIAKIRIAANMQKTHYLLAIVGGDVDSIRIKVDGVYGIYEYDEQTRYICSEHGFRNLKHQRSDFNKSDRGLPVTLTKGANILKMADSGILSSLKIPIINDQELISGTGIILGSVMGGNSDMDDFKRELIEADLAFSYYEPEARVVTRSGDRCVVALRDQWCIRYDNEEWKAGVHKLIGNLDTFHEETRKNLSDTTDWLHEWAISRTFGLGTKLPVDEKFLIESLSDSTIYTAYYTVAHLLHRSLDGAEPGPLVIRPEEMTDEVWSYVFTGIECPNHERYRLLRESFLYWYPVDLRVTGRDLIRNHLTFYLFNHVALFDEVHHPKAVRANGHILLNGEKMSKSTGNFMLMADAVERYGADGLRLALAAISGDQMTDANFTDEVAMNLASALEALASWYENYVPPPESHSGLQTLQDELFMAEIDTAIRVCHDAYEKVRFYDIVVVGFNQLITQRNIYINTAKTKTIDMTISSDVINHYKKVQLLLLTPICPQFCERLWAKIDSGEPFFPKPFFDERIYQGVIMKKKYLEHNIGLARAKIEYRIKQGGGEIQEIRVCIGEEYEEWHDQVVKIYNENQEKGFDTIKVMVMKDKSVRKQVPKKKRGRIVMTYLNTLHLGFREFELWDNNREYLGQLISDGRFRLSVCRADQDSLAKPMSPTFLII